MSRRPPRDVSDATRLIRVGKAPAKLARSVGPPIQRGSTVLLPNAAALYDERQPTYGRGGLAAQETLMDACLLYTSPSPRDRG